MPHLSPDQISAVCRLIQSAGQTVRQMSGQAFQVYEKGRQDYVTDVDRALDQQIAAGLAALFPDDPIITEENPDSWLAFGRSSRRLWLIDPLDGTDDFIQGSDDYVIMIGLSIADQPVLGWLYAPVSRQLYYGGLDGLYQAAAEAAPTVLQPVSPPPPSSSFCPILIGHKDRQRFGAALKRQIPAAQFSYVGSFGLKVMQVLLGGAGLYVYFNRRVKLWDTAGPLALAKAAGLVCCDLEGEPLRFTPDVIDAANLAHQQAIIIGWPDYIEALLPLIQQAV
ncbi:3'(2'),5'-bisphosphate nucleotidase CysQ family protein [Rivularia sp. UHCC 0363]|uniref:3'(2'),5'-bisphosphate nucleotidase CysQ family protein n=1 Tax=Rivularia sp. UHCC 0363 TaxID=3110244 RepID=UPI002B20DA21|nr:inositol monophosphatase family protein [Rivularia sp. UHCC 0363]MEA5597475.1 inositol monophosphatase family protein [Rivularia sp. UHCC 0363]